MKPLFWALVFFALVSLQGRSQTAPSTVWTEDYTQKLYNELDNVIKPRIPDSLKRRDFLLYTVKRLKEVLPMGMESIPSDSLTRLSRKIGSEYAFAHRGNTGLAPYPIPWTPENEQLFKKAFLMDWPKDDLPRGNALCDCAIKKLKEIYPNKVLMPPPKDVALKVVSECQDEIKRSEVK